MIGLEGMQSKEMTLFSTSIWEGISEMALVSSSGICCFFWLWRPRQKTNEEETLSGFRSQVSAGQTPDT